MPKRKSKKQNDFQKVKFKVGKKLPKGDNFTSTSFKSKAIVIREQLKETSTDDLRQDVLKKSRNPQELFAHLQHYNPSFRLSALNTIKAIIVSDPIKLLMHVGVVLDRVASLTCDQERDIRSASLECLRSMFEVLDAECIETFVSLVIARLLCAMNHLNDNIKYDSLKLLQLLLTYNPNSLKKEILKLLKSFLDLVSIYSPGGKRMLKVSPDSKLSTAKWRQQAFSYLKELLMSATRKGSVTTKVSWESRMVVDSPLTSVNFHNAMYLHSEDLERKLFRPVSLSLMTDTEEIMLEQIVQELLPLIRESWVETYSKEQGFKINSEVLTTLNSLVAIMRQIYHLVGQSEVKDKSTLTRILQKELSYYMNYGFPIGGKSMSDSASKNVKSKPNVSGTPTLATLINIQLYGLFKDLKCPGYKDTASYIQRILNPGLLNGLKDDIQIVLECLPTDFLMKRVVSSLATSTSLTQEAANQIIRLLSTHLSSVSAFECKIPTEVVDSLILMTLNYITKEPMIANRSLQLLNHMLYRTDHYLKATQFTELLEATTQSMSTPAAAEDNEISEEEVTPIPSERFHIREVLRLVHHVDDVEAVLSPVKLILLDESLQLTASEVNQLLSILNMRYKQEDVSMEAYLSFLCSLFANKDSDISSLEYVTDILVPSLCQHILCSFDNFEQVIEIIDYFFMKLFDSGEVTFLGCVSLLYCSPNRVLLRPGLLSHALYSIMQLSLSLEHTDNQKFNQYFKVLLPQINSQVAVLEGFYQLIANHIVAERSEAKLDTFSQVISLSLRLRLQLLVDSNVLQSVYDSIQMNSLCKKLKQKCQLWNDCSEKLRPFLTTP